jgi:hypothetical protein
MFLTNNRLIDTSLITTGETLQTQQSKRTTTQTFQNKRQRHNQIKLDSNMHGRMVDIYMVDNLVVNTRGLGGDEADALHLAGVVESKDSNEGVGVLLVALADLLEDLSGIGASEHGQLPHGPVAAIIVSRRAVVITGDESDLAEFQAGNPVGADEVLDLLEQFLL